MLQLIDFISILAAVAIFGNIASILIWKVGWGCIQMSGTQYFGSRCWAH